MSRQVSTSSHKVIDEAANWLVILEERELSDAEHSKLNGWRQQSPEHELTWQAMLRLKGMMHNMHASLGKEVWGRDRLDRRGLLKTLASLAIIIPTGRYAWEQWPALSADYRTGVGEQNSITLADSSHLQLNTATRVNVNYTTTERRIELIEGEIFITTAQSTSRSLSVSDPRPFIVTTSVGSIQALGTRFGVFDVGLGQTRVSVYEHAVAVQPSASPLVTRIESGQLAHFDKQNLLWLQPLHEPVPAWVLGKIIADDQSLSDFIMELARYRSGVLRCDPAVADLRISGVFQLQNTNQILNILASTLPVRISRLTDYWVTVTSR